MAIEMKVPTVGESITEVTIASWMKKDGDFVKMDEIICELESDKATFELPSEAEGILRIVGQEGETLEIGAVICRIEPAQQAAAQPAAQPVASVETPKAEDPKPSGQTRTIEITVPEVGESITEVTVGSWLKNTGDTVALDELILELESDKATFELPSPGAGVLTQVAKEGEVIPIGGVLATLAVGGGIVATHDAPKDTATEQAVAAPVSGGADTYASGHPSPAAGKILAEKGISPDAVQGTGVGGRITKDDAVNAAAPVAKPAEAPKATPEIAAAAQPAGERVSSREKMSSLRKTISRRLVAVKNQTAMLTTFNEVNMKPIMDIRKLYKDKFKEAHGVGLGFMSFFTKAVTMALKEYPAVNAYIDGDDIIYNDFIDVSIAVSAPKGLMVPVIRNAEKLSFDQIEAEIIRLATRARDNKLSLEEMAGGTFTITNGGIFGSMMSTPIINSPQSGILGMHNIVDRPVVENGEIVIRPMMYVALSYDHRIIDGRESVGFLVRVKQLLEDPMRMLLQV